MRVVYWEWNSLLGEDMARVMICAGFRVERVRAGKTPAEPAQWERLRRALAAPCEFVFSFNYFPEVSQICQERAVRYVSWVYDSPYIQAYSYTIVNACNRLFLFDYAMYEELRRGGIETVRYLPLGVPAGRLRAMLQKKDLEAAAARYSADVSFVGSLYTEQKHRIYDRFKAMPPFWKGYLDGLMAAQQEVSGLYFLPELIGGELLEELQRVYPTDPNATTVMEPAAVYADYVFARQITANERRAVLQAAGEAVRDGREGTVRLYTWQKDAAIPGVETRGPVDYYDEMPYVFACSRINLNITLRSIKTGIPLRAFDIMGSGGFLLSSYQEELPWYFTPGEDFVYYENPRDCAEKIRYYLTREDERRRIAENGCRKVRREHTLERRFQAMLEAL